MEREKAGGAPRLSALWAGKSGPVMGMWLFHLHNMLGIRPFSPIFRFLQSFRWRASWLRPFLVHSAGTSKNKAPAIPMVRARPARLLIEFNKGPVMGMWLFHLHHMLGIRPLSPVFRFLQSFRWRASWMRPFFAHSAGTSRNKNRFLWHSLKTRHQPFAMTQPKKFEPRREVRWRGLGTCWISRGRVLREGEGRRKSLRRISTLRLMAATLKVWARRRVFISAPPRTPYPD